MFPLTLLPLRKKSPNFIGGWDSAYITPPPCWTQLSLPEPLHSLIACRLFWEKFHSVLTLSRCSQPVQWPLTSTSWPLVEALPEAYWKKPLHLKHTVLSKSPSIYARVKDWLRNTIHATARLGYSWPATHTDPCNVCNSDLLPFKCASPTCYIERKKWTSYQRMYQACRRTLLELGNILRGV